MSKKASATLPGTVKSIIKSPTSKKQEKALIAVEGADQLFREIRIANTLMNDNDDDVSLKAGAQVLVTVATK